MKNGKPIDSVKKMRLEDRQESTKKEFRNFNYYFKNRQMIRQ